MPHDWIKDVLPDLRDFARLNDMPDLALHLAGALTVALAVFLNLISGPVALVYGQAEVGDMLRVLSITVPLIARNSSSPARMELRSSV